MNLKCPKCKSDCIEIMDNRYDTHNWCLCETCGHKDRIDEFKEK